MFAAAPTPPRAANSPVTSPSPSRPGRLRGLSYLRNLNPHQHHQRSDSLSSGSPPLSRPISTPDQRPVGASSSRPLPAAPSTFLNQSIGYLASLANSHADVRSRSVALSQEGASDSDEEPRANMARKKKNNAQQQQQQQQQAASHQSSSHANGRGGRGPSTAADGVEPRSPENSGLQGLPLDQMPTIKFIPHHDQRSNKPSLSFQATSRTLPHEDCVIRVGRYSERDVNTNPPPNVPSAAPVGFKSKVVSRRHCEFWCSQGQWYIKDVKSSSGTFLNHIRLSQPSVESRPFPVNDGDVVQLGIDFRGGEEQIFRCVKIRIECNRAWQKGLNSFNMSTHKRLRALGATNNQESTGGDTASSHSTATECSICLMSVAPCQSLFVAPCSHVWHFKCIRPILNNHRTYPQFICPNCRAVANLEDDVDDPNAAGMGDWDSGGILGDMSDPDDAALREAAQAEMNIAAIEAASVSSRRQSGDDMPLDTTIRDLRISSQHSQHSQQSLHSQSQQQQHGGSGQDTQSSTTTSAVSRQVSRQSSSNATQPPQLPAQPASEPINIPNPWSQSIEIPPNNMRAMSPGSDGANGDGHHHNEGPLTPRNDAGPFVFDGSGGAVRIGATGGS